MTSVPSLGREPSVHSPLTRPLDKQKARGEGRGALALDSQLSTLDSPAAPLRLVHLGPCMVRGGSEQSFIDLARFLDPGRVRAVRALVTTPHLVDAAVAADLQVPVEIATPASLRRAVSGCDVLLSWGLPLNEWLPHHARGPLIVFVAHGDGQWTRSTLEQSDQVVDHVVAVSDRVRDRVCHGFPTTVILNGVDAARLSRSRPRSEVRRSLGFEPRDFVLGYLGRFAHEKQPELLVEAVSRLPRRFKALMIGWGPLRAELVARAAARIPGRYAILSASKYLGDYYGAMDAFCLPSAEEGFALVVLEAMMCGRPVIATPVGAVPQVITNRVTGLLVSPDAGAVARAARLMCDHPHWTRGIAAEGRKYAERYGHARRMARDYEQLLETLWRQKRAAARHEVPKK